jgi:flavin reductase (DIM6/NTAB) family NADH-FMN oxidoreductase RutF
VLADTQLMMCPFPSTTDVPDTDDMAAPSSQLTNDFRHGIGHLARGVTVLTTSDRHGERYGVTTTGVCVLSVDPPTLVVCVRRRSKLGTHLPLTRRFCVNVLSGRQRTVAEAFAGRLGLPVDRFNHGQWTAGITGSPVLAGALASFECEVDLLYGYPNHMIVVGSIHNVVLSPEQLDPLVYTSGQLSSLSLAGNAAMAAPA